MKIPDIDDDEGILLNLRHLLELTGHTACAAAFDANSGGNPAADWRPVAVGRTQAMAADLAP
ncbi:MAG: hypothetical protein EXS42_04625 [Lacunisphaera sp.]|nr:hypothetical protein [Lacunisphaera sp.]